MKHTIIFVLIVAVISLGWFFYKPKQTNLKISVEGTLATSDLVNISLPKQGSKIISPIDVSGEARGNWYFEASAPVFVYDSNGSLLGESHVEAVGNWMTEDFVPFKGVVNFSKPSTSNGAIVFKNDNPSGDPTRSKYIIVPVNF